MFQIIINSDLIMGFLCHTSCDLFDLQIYPYNAKIFIIKIPPARDPVTINGCEKKIFDT
jgi:hypothetical protein